MFSGRLFGSNKQNDIYKIDGHNARTDAIIRLGKNVTILKINGEDVSGEGLTCEDLNRIVEEKRGETFQIECTPFDAASAPGVLPDFNFDQDVHRKMFYGHKCLNKDEIEKVSGELRRYLNDILFGSDACSEPPKLPTLYGTDIINCLVSLQDEFNIIGAADCWSPHRFIFQLNVNDQYHTFVMKYKYNSNTTIVELPRLIFNIDRGFQYSGADHPVDHALHHELQRYFYRWKENNYQGSVIFAGHLLYESASFTDRVIIDPAANFLNHVPGCGFIHLHFLQKYSNRQIAAGVASVTLAATAAVAGYYIHASKGPK